MNETFLISEVLLLEFFEHLKSSLILNLVDEILFLQLLLLLLQVGILIDEIL